MDKDLLSDIEDIAQANSLLEEVPSVESFEKIKFMVSNVNSFLDSVNGR